MDLSIQRIILAALAAAVASILLAAIIGAPDQSEAALVERGDGAQVVIGTDDDNLNNADVLSSGSGNDVLIGLLGSDVMQGGKDRDILVGGTEQFSQPNSHIMFGGTENDTNVWAPGDGSDAFLGEKGLDAQVFGVIDRDANNVPTLSEPVSGFPNGVPTANVTGSP